MVSVKSVKPDPAELEMSYMQGQLTCGARPHRDEGYKGTSKDDVPLPWKSADQF